MTRGVGNLNGKWEALFKTFLVTWPLIITASGAWCVWVTTSVFDLKAKTGTNADSISRVEGDFKDHAKHLQPTP